MLEELCHIVFNLVCKAIDSDVDVVLFGSYLAGDACKRCHVVEFSQAFVEHIDPHHAEDQTLLRSWEIAISSRNLTHDLHKRLGIFLILFVENLQIALVQNLGGL